MDTFLDSSEIAKLNKEVSTTNEETEAVIKTQDHVDS